MSRRSRGGSCAGLKSSDELGFPRPIDTRVHEAVLSIFVTASLLGKEADRVLQGFGLTQAQFDIAACGGASSG